MSVDYYDVLEVGREAGEDELRKAYRRLAMKWHPDKNHGIGKDEAEYQFKLISEAYDVLSNPRRRQIYDSQNDEVSKSCKILQPGDDRCGTGIEVRGEWVKKSKSRSHHREAAEAECNRPESKNYNGKPEGRNSTREESNGSLSIQVYKLQCCLEELYTGSNRRLKISRSIANDSGSPRTIEEILVIHVKPGWRKGTKITFPQKGNQELGGAIPGDLVFVLEEKAHAVFRRDGNDLVVHQSVTLTEALTGKTFSIVTLDRRTLKVGVIDIVRPGYELVVENEGMPISKELGRKGNLRIKFDIQFPSRLTADKKNELKRILGGS